MGVQIKPLFQSVGPTALEEFEAKIKARLPEAYRDFLLRYNGGIPTPNVFRISSEEGYDCVSVFYGVATETVHDLWSNALDLYDVLARHMLPIGHDPGGNRIVMNLHPNAYGAIYFYDHERGCAEGLSLMAPDFTTFLESLRETDDE